MLVRSFAAPLAFSVLGCVASIGLLMGGAPQTATSVVPYALLTQALSLGSSAIADSATLNLVEVAKVAAPSLALALMLTALAAVILDRREIKA